jgi:hypothetical protein
MAGRRGASVCGCCWRSWPICRPLRRVGASGRLVEALRLVPGVAALRQGYGRSAWPILEEMVRRGQDVPIGLAGVMLLLDGHRAADNAEPVPGARGVVNRCVGTPLSGVFHQ